jgi:hypothetical protein
MVRRAGRGCAGSQGRHRIAAGRMPGRPPRERFIELASRGTKFRKGGAGEQWGADAGDVLVSSTVKDLVAAASYHTTLFRPFRPFPPAHSISPRTCAIFWTSFRCQPPSSATGALLLGSYGHPSWSCHRTCLALLLSSRTDSEELARSRRSNKCIEIYGILANMENGCVAPMIFTPAGKDYRIVEMRQTLTACCEGIGLAKLAGDFLLCPAPPSEPICAHPIDYVRLAKARKVIIRRSHELDARPTPAGDRWVAKCDPAFAGRFHRP